MNCNTGCGRTALFMRTSCNVYGRYTPRTEKLESRLLLKSTALWMKSSDGTAKNQTGKDEGPLTPEWEFLPRLEITLVLVRFDQVASIIVNENDENRFVVRADEKLSAFLELESTIRTAERPQDCAGHEIKFDKLSQSSKSLFDYVIRRFTLSSARLNKPQGYSLRHRLTRSPQCRTPRTPDPCA